MIKNEGESSAARRAAKICLVGGLLVLALWIDRNLLPALIWAAILAIATSPLHDLLARTHPRLRDGALLPSLFTAVFALAVLVPLALILVEAAREQAAVLQWIASARAKGIATPAWVQQLPFGAGAVSHWWQANLATPGGASAELNQLNTSAVHHGRLWGAEVIHRSVLFALALVAYFFLLKEQATIVAELRIAGYRMLGPTGERVARQVVLSVRGTINGLVFVGLGEGAVMTVVYWLAGAPHAVLLGVVTAVAAMIPFGAVLVFVVAALLILVQGSALAAGAVLVTGLLVVAIADHFIRPALIGGATRLPFLLVLFGILGGVETLGLLGLFVGPGVMAALVLLWREYVHGSSRKNNGRSGASATRSTP
ncbi:MAG TPA: AI-2E family transporter [Sphingomicrobium sp.]|nr:AI-2E family transporter [Sphingomicrobium sp.]